MAKILSKAISLTLLVFSLNAMQQHCDSSEEDTPELYFNSHLKNISSFIHLNHKLEVNPEPNNEVLVQAILNNNKAQIKNLLSKGQPILTPIIIASPLYYAISSSDLKLTKLLLSYAQDILNFKVGALVQTCAKKSYKELEDILCQSKSINEKDVLGKTVLWYAVNFRDLKAISLLIAAQADVEGIDFSDLILRKDKFDISRDIDVIHTLKAFKQKEAQEYLKDRKSYLKHYIEYIQHYKKHPRFDFNQTLLMWAAIINDISTIDILLALTSPLSYINAKDHDGNTAFMYAIKFNNCFIAQRLMHYIKSGVFIKNNEGRTPLELAALGKNNLMVIRIVHDSKLHLPALMKAMTIALNKNEQSIINGCLLKLLSYRDIPIERLEQPLDRFQAIEDFNESRDKDCEFANVIARRTYIQEVLTKLSEKKEILENVKNNLLKDTECFEKVSNVLKNDLEIIEADLIYIRNCQQEFEMENLICEFYFPHDKDYLVTIMVQLVRYSKQNPQFFYTNHIQKLINPLQAKFFDAIIKKYSRE